MVNFGLVTADRRRRAVVAERWIVVYRFERLEA
jgi:hypothetical protein